MSTPSRTEVARIIDRLLSGELSREDASLWAGPLHLQEAPDPVVEEALDLLTLVDAWQTDECGNRTGYLYDFVDLVAIRKLLGDAADG